MPSNFRPRSWAHILYSREPLELKANKENDKPISEPITIDSHVKMPKLTVLESMSTAYTTSAPLHKTITHPSGC